MTIPEINPAEFRIPASDTKGHSERVWARVQPMIERQVEIIVSSRSFPYKSKGDLIRHAIHRHVAWLEGLAPFPSITKQIEAIADIMREEEFHADFEDVFRRLTTQVTSYISDGNITQARSLVSRVRSKLEGMPAGEWKKRYLTTIDTKLGHLLKGQALDLLGAEEEERK